jgi:peptidyl-prolyl cis-trans isomerase SurA
MEYVSKELRMMKWSVALTSLLFGLVTFAGTAWGSEAKGSDASARTLVDRVAAVVEGDVITLRALETLAARPLAELARYENPKERAARRKAILVQALDSVLSEKMIELEIDSNPDLLTINDQDIDRAIGDVTRMNQIDREQLRQAVEAQGIT